MRTKLLLAVLPLGLAAASMTGCGNNANANISGQVATLTDKMAITQKSGLGLEESQRVYTRDHAVGSWTIPADPSTAAAKQDELNVLAAEIATAHADPNASPAQKAVLARMLGDIYLSDARYLSAAADASYSHARARAVDLQPYADKINAIQGLITILEGDREVIINTLQTGDTGGLVEINGIDQLTERAEAIQARLDEAKQAYEDYEQKAQELSDTAIEFEQAELEHKTEARTLTGDAQFDALDQAVESWLKARLAEIEAEYNGLLGAAERQNADLNAADLVQVNSVIEQLEEGIAEVRADINALRTRVNDAESERRSAADELANEFDIVNSRMEALVFDRLATATAQAAEAVAAYAGITTTGQAQNAMRREQLTALLMQLNVMQQHAVSMGGYKSAIDTLAANGDEVLGPSLANTLELRSADLGSQIEAIQTAAGPLITEARTLAESLTQSSGGNTTEAETLSRQKESLQSIQATVDALPY